MTGAAPEADRYQLDGSEVILRTGVFVTLVLVCRFFLPFLLVLLPLPEGSELLIRSVLSSFGAGLLASYACARIFEQGRLRDLGLGLSGALRPFSWGVITGAIAASATLTIPLALGWAAVADHSGTSLPGTSLQPTLGMIAGLLWLLLGAAGEELMFHGYAFQLLLGQRGGLPPSPARKYSPWLTIAAVGVIFGGAHMSSNHAPPLAAANTIAWGCLLGYACWRTEALWLPIGLHFGWNAVFPLFGVNLSGITMGVNHAGLRWNVGELWSGGTYGPEAGLFTTGIVVMLGVALPAISASAVKRDRNLNSVR